MNRWKGKISVVTGASAGIGLAIAKALIRDGMIVVGLARRKEKMEAEMESVEGKEKFYAIQCDVTIEKSVADAFDWIKKNLGVVQIIINNAGIATSGKIYETSRKDWEMVFNINVMGLLECSKHAINMMREADVEGHVVNINSIQGRRVYNLHPLTCHVYPGTKHAVTALTETMQLELLGGKIRVTSICPGFVRTEIVEADDFNFDFSKLAALQSEDVADAVIYVIGTPKHVEITELTIKPHGERFHY